MSDDFFPAYVPDKDELKERLPLAYVCAQLGIALDREGRALCPWHEMDGQPHSPSFYLWDGDVGQGNAKVRWACQPCGLGGDIFELLQRYEGLEFMESVRRAADLYAHLPTGWEDANPKPVYDRPNFLQEWEAFINQTRVHAFDKPGLMAVISGLVDDSAPEQEAQAWDEYLRRVWGWGLDENFNVYMPHWDAAGTMTGCKVRRGQAKDSLGGSTYGQFYGSWITKTTGDVLLTEGESDCVYAAYTAEREGIPISVYALPRGAASADAAWLSVIAGARTVYLGFDPDEKGIQATREWIAILADKGFRDIRACSLPWKKDMKSARVTMSHLLAGALHPIAPPDNIMSEPGGYSRESKDGHQRAITNWTIDPKARLIGGEDPGYDVILTHRGNSREEVIRLADLANVNKLKAWCNSRGLIFGGNQQDVEAIASLVFAQGSITPEIFQTDQVGIQPPPEAYEFLGPTVVYPKGYEGALPWRYVPTTRTADVSDKMLLPDPGAVWKWRWLEDFLALNTPDVTHPILAWIAASARRAEAKEFPMLFLGGSSGVGKSTLARLALRLSGSDIETDLGSSTPFILVRTLASSTNIPVFVDEWTRMSRKDTREAFQSYVPNLYAGGLAERGMSDLGSQVYRLTAPVIVAGEDTFSLDRERDRVVNVSPTRAGQNHAALAAIEYAPLHAFARLYHRWLVHAPKGLPPISFAASSRPEHNKEVLLAGWKTLLMWMEGVAELDTTVPTLPEVPDLSCFDIDPTLVDDNVYEQAIQEGMLMHDAGGTRVVWPDPGGRGTWIRAQLLITLIERNTDIELPGRSRALLNYFSERYGRTENTVTRAPMATQDCRATLVYGYHLAIAEDPEPEDPTPV